MGRDVKKMEREWELFELEKLICKKKKKLIKKKKYYIEKKTTLNLLTHFSPLFHFYTPENIFSGYRNGTLG